MLNIIKNVKIIVGLVVVVIVVAVAAGLYFTLNSKTVAAQDVGDKAIEFINENLLQGIEASLVSVEKDSDYTNLYKLKLSIAGTEYTSYATRDGKLLFTDAYEMTPKEEANSESSADVPKSDKPDVKLFIMTYCPYGLQAQKMFVPVYNLLKDKVDMGIYFVDYAMHEKTEVEENIRQYCIQKEEKNKYMSYLTCFTQEGDYEKCLSEANINVGKNNNCYFETDKEYNITADYNNESTWLSGRYPVFAIDQDLNDKYGIEGSPTIVINDKVVNIGARTPENFKNIICAAFNDPPEECLATLSSDAPSAGFGGGTGSSSSGSCN